MGTDPDHVLRQAEAPFSIDDLYRDTPGGISDQQFVRIHRECITVLSAQANRERNLPPMSKQEVDMLCYCVITCNNLRDVIERAGRFCAMLGGRAAALTLEECGAKAVFHMTTQRERSSVSALLTDLSGLSFYRRLFSWLIGEHIPVESYQVYASAVVDHEMLECFFQEPINLCRPDNAFVFPAQLLEKPVIRNAQALEEVLEVFPFDTVGDPRNGNRLSEAIEQIMQARLAQQKPLPTLEQFARAFNMSRATLQRRLRRESMTIKEIRQKTLQRLAMELLKPEHDLKVSDVAQQLGFSDARSFRRAFLTWTRTTPDEWRSQSRQAQMSSMSP